MKKKQKNSVMWLLNKSKKQMGLIILLTFLSMLVSVSYIVPALLSKAIINSAVNSASLTDAKGDIIKYAIILLIFVVITVGVMILNSHLSAVIEGRLEKDMRHSFFETITKKEYSKLSDMHSGEILNRFTSDIDIVISGITSFVPEAISIVAKAVAGFILILSFSKSYACFVLLVGLFIILCAFCLKPFYKKIHRRTREATGVMRGFTQECTENMVVVKTFSNSGPLLEKLDSYLQKIYDLQILRNHVGNIAGGGATLIYRFVYYATLCWGAFMIANKAMDYGTLMAFMQIVSQISSPFFNASSLITQLYSAMASAERLAELEDIPDEISALDFDANSVYENMTHICAEGLNFGYNKKSIISNTTFSIKKGDCVAITGLSGTGKSTLFKLMLGLYSPTSGKLFVKTNASPIDLAASTRSLFAYVPQGNLLISGSLRENITFGNENLSEEAMISAAKTACIYDFITSLPDGFDTKIGEHGLGLSEGQIQRIAVARALCCNAPILMLDECTSALDAQTEEDLLTNIKKLNTKTILFISHKNAVLSICDTHLHMEDGHFEIVEQ